jgi:hypothetical protein
MLRDLVLWRGDRAVKTRRILLVRSTLADVVLANTGVGPGSRSTTHTRELLAIEGRDLPRSSATRHVHFHIVNGGGSSGVGTLTYRGLRSFKIRPPCTSVSLGVEEALVFFFGREAVGLRRRSAFGVWVEKGSGFGRLGQGRISFSAAFGHGGPKKQQQLYTTISYTYITPRQLK